jgi:transposase
VWPVEDCRHVSGRLERGLLATGDRVLRVAPGLTETPRRAVREPGKSDPIDATAIARAAIRKGLDTLPAAFLDEHALEIRVLNDYHDQIIAEHVRLINRLRWHLVQIAPEAEAEIRPAGLIGPRSARDSPASSDGCRSVRNRASRRRCSHASTRATVKS